MKSEDTSALQKQESGHLRKKQLKEAQSGAPATNTDRTKEEERRHAARLGHRAEQALEMQAREPIITGNKELACTSSASAKYQASLGTDSSAHWGTKDAELHLQQHTDAHHQEQQRVQPCNSTLGRRSSRTNFKAGVMSVT